jgi:glycosyltransferase involved in cell wall biosynthesis
MHIDLCHVLFNNAAEANRLLSLQQRRGATLRPRRFELPNLGIEHADCAVIIGNKFTMDTFRYAKKPMYPVPVVGLFLYPSPEEKDVEGCRKNYLWFGSGGLVRKGLDLVLEAFAEMPDYHLTVMGPVKQEGDFEKVYHKELYETPNIHTVGWINLDGPEFLEIANQSLGLVYPSCSEGQAGSVICCLHAGLIPIVSYESGVDVEGFGTTLRECSIEEIKNSIRATSSLPGEVLRQKALKAWNYARTHHTKERYRDEYKRIVVEILERTLETPVQTRTKNK